MRNLTARDILTDADVREMTDDIQARLMADLPLWEPDPPLVKGGQGHPDAEMRGDAWAVFRFVSVLSALLSIWAAVQWAMGGAG